MRGSVIIAVAGATMAWSAPAAASSVDTETAIRRYCEPLLAGTAADQVGAAARKDGFRNEVISGQSMLRMGELLLGVSDQPRVCFVQAPAAMTFVQGAALVEAWAKRYPGARKGAATRGPDGARVAAWSVPARNVGMIASEQTNGYGRKVVNFILMPQPGR